MAQKQKRWRSEDVQLLENIDFSAMLLKERILSGLTKAGYKRPSPIQFEAIPVGRMGKDLLVQAKSGTGKTLVFTIIALEHLKYKLHRPQVLILAPAREIATQICSVIQSVGSCFPKLKCHHFIGGLPLADDKENALTCQIAVGTPGRVKHLIKEGFLPTNSIRLFVLDEADQLLQSTFKTEIDEIFSSLEKEKQVIAASATYPARLRKIIFQYFRDPFLACLNSRNLALLGIVHYTKEVKSSPSEMIEYGFKLDVLKEILDNLKFSQCLVFCNRVSRVGNLCHDVRKWGYSTTFINSEKNQLDRLKAIDRLKHFKCKVFISSDVSSRGIDAENVDLVINFDMPHTTEIYLHRVGRAGRYGTIGVAITLITRKEVSTVARMETEANCRCYKLPDPLPLDLIQNPCCGEHTVPESKCIEDKKNKEIDVHNTSDENASTEIGKSFIDIKTAKNIKQDYRNPLDEIMPKNGVDDNVVIKNVLNHINIIESHSSSEKLTRNSHDSSISNAGCSDISNLSEEQCISRDKSLVDDSCTLNENNNEVIHDNAKQAHNLKYDVLSEVSEIHDKNDTPDNNDKSEVIANSAESTSMNSELNHAIYKFMSNYEKYRDLSIPENSVSETEIQNSSVLNTVSSNMLENLKYSRSNYFYRIFKCYQEDANILNIKSVDAEESVDENVEKTIHMNSKHASCELLIEQAVNADSKDTVINQGANCNIHTSNTASCPEPKAGSTSVPNVGSYLDSNNESPVCLNSKSDAVCESLVKQVKGSYANDTAEIHETNSTVHISNKENAASCVKHKVYQILSSDSEDSESDSDSVLKDIKSEIPVPPYNSNSSEKSDDLESDSESASNISSAFDEHSISQQKHSVNAANAFKDGKCSYVKCNSVAHKPVYKREKETCIKQAAYSKYASNSASAKVFKECNVRLQKNRNFNQNKNCSNARDSHTFKQRKCLGTLCCKCHVQGCYMPSQHHGHLPGSCACANPELCKMWYNEFLSQWQHLQKCMNFPGLH